MSHLETIKANLKRLASDSLELALKELERLLSPESPVFNSFLLLKGQFKKCREEFLLGILSAEQNTQTYARLMSAFLQMTGELSQNDLIPEKETAQKPAEKRGELLYHVPHAMQVMREEKCTVRIAWTEAALLENWKRRKDDVHRRNLRIAEVMGVELLSLSEDAPFSIKSLHSTVQFLDEEEYTEWIFYVKPLRAGNYPLVIRISVIEMRDNREVKRELVLEEQVSVTTEAPQVEAGQEDMVSAPLAHFTAGAPFVEAPAFLTEVMRRHGALLTLLCVAVTAIIWSNPKPFPNDLSETNSRHQLDTFLIVLPETGSNGTTERYGETQQKKNYKQNDRGAKTHPAAKSPLDNSEDIAPNLDVIRDNHLTPLDTMPQYMKDSVAQSRLQNKMQLLRLAQDVNSLDTVKVKKELIKKDLLQRARENANLAVSLAKRQKDPTMAMRIAEFSLSSGSGNRATYLSALNRGGVYSRLGVLSPDGKYILTGSQNNTLRLWSISDTAILSRIWLSDAIYSAAFSPDGKHILSGSQDDTVRLWDIDGSAIRLPSFYSPVQKKFSFASYNYQKAQIWNAESLQRNQRLLWAYQLDSTAMRFLPSITAVSASKKSEIFLVDSSFLKLSRQFIFIAKDLPDYKHKGFFARLWDWLIFWK